MTDLVLGKRFRDESDHDSSQNIIFPEQISFQDKGFVTDFILKTAFCDRYQFEGQDLRRILLRETGFVTNITMTQRKAKFINLH